jgi:protocatechuate 3,4-dioxygenase beta subunit
VAAGRQDLRCQLQPRNRIRVRAVSPTGEVLRSYRLAVRRWFPDTPEKLGLCAEAAELRVRLDGMTDFAELPDAPEGWLVCEVEAPEFATTWSAPIDNRLLAAGGASTPPANAGGRVHQVEVRVQRGASLRGIVLDAAGAPLAGAELRTFAADAMPDNPLFQLLAGARPERTTTATATTNTNGAFRFDRLAPGAYQLRVEHPEACRSTVRDVVLAEATDQLLPPLRLPRGCQVQGRATVAGRVAGQLKVVLTTTTTTTDEALRLETVTDSDGRFRLPRRIPPGNYELRAAVVGTAEPEAQIFQQILQLQRSATTLVVAPGQTVAECSLDLPSDR